MPRRTYFTGLNNPISFGVHTDFKPETPAARSILSLPMQRKAMTVMAKTAHNFHVIVLDRDILPAQRPSTKEYFLQGLMVPRAVNLIVYPDDLPELDRANKKERESIYTAFTYLHRLGDELYSALCHPVAASSARIIATKPTLAPQNTQHEAMTATTYFTQAIRPIYMTVFTPELTGPDGEKNTFSTLFALLAHFVDSRMVREGYAASYDQAIADLLPLCELTPPSRSLFRLIDPTILVDVINDNPASARGIYKHNAETTTRILIDLLPEFNHIFRTYYNMLLPTLYGTAFQL